MHCVCYSAVHLPQNTQVSVLRKIYKKAVHAFTIFLIILLVSQPAYALTPPGTVIDNTAQAAFDVAGAGGNINSNTASVVTTIIQTPSSVALYQYDVTGSSSFASPVITQYASSAPPGNSFVPSPDPVVVVAGSGPVVLDPTVQTPLVTAGVFNSGDPVFIRVDDMDQNLDPSVREAVQVEVITSSGDREQLLLTESDVNTGIFTGYIQTSAAAAQTYNGVLDVTADGTATVSYTDQYDPSDNSTSSTLVDPSGIVFSSVDGSPVDGATVTVLDAAGNPATVYGDDAVSTYPNPVITGSTVTDSGGTVYLLPAGGYRFPRMLPGDYRIVVEPPQGYTSPSSVSINDLQALPGAPYSLDADASYGGVFTLQPGVPLFVDIPLDAQTSYLVAEKTVSKDTASIGDFIQYTLTVSNIDSTVTASNLVIKDTLPAGLRYQNGSVRYNGLPGNEPSVSSDGRILKFPFASLPPGNSVQIKYVTELTAATPAGKAVNSVVAVDSRGTRSNTAVAGITVTEDLYASRSFIAGRVIVGECDEDGARMNPGLPGVRLFMEDGTYAATDENGRYHFRGITPGTHIVQMDRASIPDNLEIVECVKNSRYAGTPYSQFVEVQGGTLWRADFHVREKKPIQDTASLYIRSELNEENIRYSVEMENGKVPVKNYRLIINLPEGIEYDLGSSMVDGVSLKDPYVNENVIVYRFGDLGSNWHRQLTFRGRIRERADGDLVTTAFVILDTAMKRNIRSTPIRNRLQVSRQRKENRHVYQTYFEPMDAELSYQSKNKLREQIKALGEVDIVKNEITGYADSRRIQKRSIWLYEDNTALSRARAKVVRDFLINEMKLDESQIELKAAGPGTPIGDNSTVQGRSLNRRAELVVNTSEIVAPGKVELVTSKSEVSELQLEGQPEVRIEKLIEAPPVTEQLDISTFDEFWIKDAVPGYEWLMPDINYSPAAPSVNIAIKHDPSDSYEMLYNGKPLNPLFFFGTIKNKKNTVARSYWQGVHLNNGDNLFEFVVRDKNGRVVRKMQRNIIYAGTPTRAELAEEFSRLVADGRNPPVVALRVYDKNGNFARPGSRGKYTLSDPYISKQEVEAFQVNRLTGLNRKEPEYIVGQNGLAFIVLEPTTVTGRLDVELPFAGRKKSRLQTWLQPEVRDWILVGLAEGTLGYNAVSGNQESLAAGDDQDAFYDRGRVAFYAKGKVKGEWLLTTAYDTSKQQQAGDRRVNQLIDPNTYYTIYGDNSRQRHDASSADKLYIKIERKQFYALFGDMDTGLTVTELSKFNRRMTGAKSEYDDGRYAFTAFAAENQNNFIKDEIRGEGISGLYRLSGRNIVINSDDIVIETRDRFRSEIIIKSEPMRRYLDYSIDYTDGTIYFRKPIASRDENFNPIFIVADYEVESPVKGDITAGGRGAVKFNEGRVEIGASAIHDGSYLNKGNLYGADARIEVDAQTEVRLEVATSDVTSNKQALSGSAYSAEVVHGGDNLRARVYAKQQDEDFGLGQQSISQKGTRKYGADANYRMSEDATVDATLYHEDNLATGAKRDVAEAGLTYNKLDYSLNAGARIANDDMPGGEANRSNLILLGASRNLLGNLLKLRANAELAVAGNNANADYPSRFILGADYFVTPKVNLFAENEWTNGRDQDTQMARAGVRSTPWQNAQINSAVNQETNENGIRSFATLGLTQGFPISKRWSGDVAFDHARTLRTPGATPFNPNVPIAQGTANNDFTAVSFGTTYNAPRYTINNRVEWRNAQLEDKVGVVLNWERNLLGGIGYSATARAFNTDRSNGTELFQGDVRFSLAYRPLQSRWIVLNRLDFTFDSNTDLLGLKTRQRKLIENLTSNFLVDNRNQVSFNFGMKYVVDSFDGQAFNGITTLLGSEYRHDLSDIFDVGVQASGLYSANSQIMKYSTGVSFGWNMTRNIWLSFGYNFNGFDDRDFSAAGYTATGPYIRFRMKFDQDTAKDVQAWLN